METSGSARGQDGPESSVSAEHAVAGSALEPADAAASDLGEGSAIEGGSQQPAPVPPGPANLVASLLIYTLLRLALVAALTALLMFFMPLIVALLFAIIVQLPLSWLLFAGPRRRLNDAMAQSSAKRRFERAKLQSALSGDGGRPADR